MDQSTEPLSKSNAQSSDVSSALHREWELIKSLPGNIGDGFCESAEDAWRHKGRTAVELLETLAVGGALALARRFPGALGGTAGIASRYAPRLMSAGFVMSAGVAVAKPVADTWSDSANQNSSSVQEEQKGLGKYLGSGMFNATLFGVAGTAGFRGIRGRSISSGLHPATAELPPVVPMGNRSDGRHDPVQPDYFLQRKVPEILATPRGHRSPRELDFARFMSQVQNKSPEQVVQEVVNPQHWLGIGKDAEVYDYGRNFVLRIYRFGSGSTISAPGKIPVVQGKEFQPVEVVLPEMNIGQEVARIDQNIMVHRRVLAPPFMLNSHCRFPAETYYPLIADYNLQNMKTAAGYPRRAYDNLARTVSAVSESGYFWESHAQNLMMRDGFHLIDVTTDMPPPARAGKTVLSMMNPFISGGFPIHAAEAVPYRREVLSKSILAAARAGINFTELPQGIAGAFLCGGLEEVGMTDWFLTQLQALERAKKIQSGAYEIWRSALKI